ncbi:MAG: isoprenyl transferase [Acidaminococcaceae bacterium]
MLKNIFTKGKNIEPKPIVVDGIVPELVPEHIAIIMDGNGRWAKAKGRPRTFGHHAGAEALKEIVKIADHIGVKVISAYAFSTENWKRPITEVSFIMDLLSKYLSSEIKEFNENNVRVRFMGSRLGLPTTVLEKMDTAMQETKDNTGIILNLAINYGGQAEILRAVQNIAAAAKAGSLTIEEIDGTVFENYLYTKELPPPDLLIRPGGDFRISNFMLWQIAYAEIWTTTTYWPDFTPAMFLQAISEYQKRDRRYGGLNNK